GKTERYIYAEIKAALVSGAYPAVLATSTGFLKNYSQSIYRDNVQLCRGQAYFHLGEYTDAMQVLQKSEKSTNNEIKGSSQYWQGRIAYDLKQYEKAVNFFYKAAKISYSRKNKTAENDCLTTSVLLYSGKSLYALKEYEQAIHVFRSYLYNFAPDKYYQKITCMICAAYYHSENYNALVQFYNNVFLEGFTVESVEVCKTYAAGAYLALNNPERSYTLYTDLLISKNKQRALAALQQAYSIASSFDFVTEQDLLDNASNHLGDEPEVMHDLWVRTGISCFEEKEYSDALAYFIRADAIGNKSGFLWETSGFYQSKIYLYNGENKKAASLLLARYNEKSSLSAWYLVAQAELAALDDLWIDAEHFALLAVQKIKKDENKTQELYYSERLYNEALYWQSMACYKRNDFSKAVQTLQESSNFKNGGYATLLYAQSLHMLGEEQGAIVLLEKYFPEEEATAITQLKNGQYLDSWKTALSIGNDYLCGLSAYCMADWERASFYFQTALLKNQVSSEKESWAQYYYAVSLYHQGQYTKSLSLFESFLSTWSYHGKAWEATMTAAMCAMQISDITMEEKAIMYATRALQIARTRERKIASSVLAASLYSDAKKYAKSIEVLKPLVDGYSDDTVQIRFQLADVYALAGRLDDADAELSKITDIFKLSEFAREAAYRRGEIYYRAEKHEKAADAFSAFGHNWPDGVFSDSALFFGAESLVNSGQSERAILLYKELVELFSEGPYCFAAMDSLIHLYRKTEEYQAALDIANKLLAMYGDQAKNIGINSKIAELEMLIGGGDEQTTRLYSIWIENDKNNTAKGREASFNLASIYCSSTKNHEKGVQMLHDLRSFFEKSTIAKTPAQDLDSQGREDINLYARVLNLQAKNAREDADFRMAAELYVKAAERYAATGYSNSFEEAARAMYGAVEAFDASQRFADSQAVYNTMKETFTDSEWTLKAAKIID
ncbi:MAG TPA: tetratricopeptide repeat protein, partial [Treponemataceae bacterium]|nr:tetratricopeptide repeat protein [Treponemataceae bacterium]